MKLAYTEKARKTSRLFRRFQRERTIPGAVADEGADYKERIYVTISSQTDTKPGRDFQAGAGIEPANSGFADRDLTTWLPRRCEQGA